MLRSAAVGLACGLISFAGSGWFVYSLLWRYTGQDELVGNAGTSGVVLGAVWCLGIGLASGALIGIVTTALTTRYVYRRQREENPQRAL